MYLIDPKTNKPSVTLTLMLISFGLLTVGSIAMILGKVDSIGALLEVYIANATLYFGRRFTVKTKSLEIKQEGDK